MFRSARSLALAAGIAVCAVAAPGMAFAGPSATSAVAAKPASSASYPYARANPGGLDPWGSMYRQCTSFASWWLSTHGVPVSRLGAVTGPRGTVTLGNGANWDAAARQAGYAVSKKPVVGAIAQWHANEVSRWTVGNGRYFMQAAGIGHVGVVRAVYKNGLALIQDYNGNVSLGPSSFTGKAPRYLVIK